MILPVVKRSVETMLQSRHPQTIIVCNPKGGAGKTTLATNLAVALANNGYQVTLHDLDPQLSALDWSRSRPQHCPEIVLSQQPDLDRSGWHIIDTPAGFESKELADLAPYASHIVIPVLPSSFDIHASVRFLMALHKADLFSYNLKMGMVSNRVKQNTLSQKTLDAFLEHLNIPFLAQINDSQNYVKASERGLGIYDLPAYRVRKELQQWQQILNWLKVDDIKIATSSSPLRNPQHTPWYRE